MADAVTSQTIGDEPGAKRILVKLTNIFNKIICQ